MPEDYGDTFMVMGEVGAMDTEFSENHRNMARFSNRLVHLYWEIDDKQLYRYLSERLGDFKTFLDAIAKFLSWHKLA